MPLLLVSASIFFSYFFLLIRLGITDQHQKFIFSGFFLFAQIILTELSLGIIGWLYLPTLIWLNLAISLIVILVAQRSPSILPQPVQRTESLIGPENISLFILLGILIAWMAIAIYFLPPRAYDDRGYHLTPIYEYVLSHRIFLLPVEIFPHFSLPENAEFLFMWPAIFFHSQQFVDGIQFVVALWGIIVIYGLARTLNVLPKTALFISLLFVFSPLVLSQMGSNYIDIITAVFFLVALYSAILFYQREKSFYLYTTFLAAGLLTGMKYNQLLLLISLIPFLWSKKKLITPARWLSCGVIFCLCGGYWYLRNFLILHKPIFTDPAMSNYIEFPTPIHLLQKLLYVWQDIGLGTLHGGYGLIFWGLAMPAWLYVLGKAALTWKNEQSKMIIRVGLALVLGMGQLMAITLKDLHYDLRYSLFVIGLGLLALGQTLTIFDEISFFRRTVKGLCIFFAFLSLLHLGVNQYPGYHIERSLKDFIQHKRLPDQFYAYRTLPNKNYSQQAFALIEYLTIQGEGMSVYVIRGNKPVTSSIYGTKLQNRVWNFQSAESRKILPDAILYFGKSMARFRYSGPVMPPGTIRSNPDYVLLVENPSVLFFIRKDFLALSDKQQRLASFQEIMVREKGLSK